MKKILIFISLININNVFAQNLVPNYSFEDFNVCPFGTSQILKAAPWFQPHTNGGSTDFFNECANQTTGVSVPINFIGQQSPRTGKGYAGFAAYAFYSSSPNGSGGREYLEVQLIDSLIASKKYVVSFYVSLGEKSRFAIKTLGVYFSKDSILYSAPRFIALAQYIPQIINKTNDSIKDSVNWVQISDTFIAQGGEKFITIGNFNPDSTSKVDSFYVFNYSSTFAYYYIDDVSVIPDTTTGLTPSSKGEGVSLYPNPVTDKLFIDLSLSAGSVEVILYDVIGKEQKRYSFAQSTQINMQDFAKGIYFYKIYREHNLLQVGKIVKQ